MANEIFKLERDADAKAKQAYSAQHADARILMLDAIRLEIRALGQRVSSAGNGIESSIDLFEKRQ